MSVTSSGSAGLSEAAITLPLRKQWIFDIPGQAWTSATVLPDRTVLTYDKNQCIRLTLETGEVISRQETSVSLGFPFLHDDRLYAVGRRVADSDQTPLRVFCMDQGGTKELWSVPTAGIMEQAEVAHERGLLFMPVWHLFEEARKGERGIVAVSLKDGEILWEHKSAVAMHHPRYSAKHDRVVALEFSDRALKPGETAPPPRLVCLDGSRGTLCWELPIEGFMGFVVDEDKVFVSTTGLRGHGEPELPQKEGLHCLDLLTGQNRWFYKHERFMVRLQPHPDGILYGGGSEPCAASADDGRMLWQIRYDDLPFEITDGGPRAGGPLLIVGDYLVNIYLNRVAIFDRHNGKLLQAVTKGIANVSMTGAPQFAHGYILCCSSNTCIVCLGPGKPARKAK